MRYRAPRSRTLLRDRGIVHEQYRRPGTRAGAVDETSSHGVVERPWVIDANASVVFEDVIAALRVAADNTRDTIMMTHAESVDTLFANAPFCAL